MAELNVTIGGEDYHLTDENTTVFTFRDARHMDHVFIVNEGDKSTVLFAQPEFVRKLIDMDFPLQTARWPRPFDFEAYEKYIEMLANELNQEIEGL